MPERIKIKCPNPACSKELPVDYSPRMENHSATCPYCKKRYKFSEWIKVTPMTIEQPQPPTMPEPPRQKTAHVVVQSTGDVFQLIKGVNILGRKSPQSRALIQIPNIYGTKRTSKEHLVIIADETGGRLNYTIELFKAGVNPTFVCGEQLFYGQRRNLNSGDIINLPDETLLFEVVEV
jgi:hypothetical protein